MIVDQRYPTNNSNYAKDPPNIIEVHDIKYSQKDAYTPTRRSLRLNFPQYQRLISPIHTTNESLFAVIPGEMGQPKHWVSTNLKNDGIKKGAIDLQEFCARGTHPTTDGTVTNFQKIMKIPELKKVWSEEMCTKLKNISQGWDKNRGTNTVRFLTHKEIAMIQKDRIVTYTRVVVDYRSQKDDQNRFQLVVGRNKLKATRRHLIPKYDTSFQKTRRSHTPTFSAASDLINQRPNESV